VTAVITIRPITDLTADARGIFWLTNSFTTDRIYRVVETPNSFTLLAQTVDPPAHKFFSLVGELQDDHIWSHGWVAEEDARIVGFAALRMEQWNRRGVLWHLYIDANHRGHGLGSRLLAHVEDAARELGASRLWLETSNLNYPAVGFYRKHGYALVGLDTSLYAPDGEAAGEVALYFAKPLAIVANAATPSRNDLESA
jgi:ribosomal protein S18 acetylase RimI-like enzyme